MRHSRVKTIWADGGAAINGWLSIPSSFSAELMARQRFDSVTIDLQHGIVDYQVAVTMLQAIATTDVMPIARVPWNDPGIIMKMLDAGAYGIICPMVNSAEEASRFVRACRYPPDGFRSWGPTRASLDAQGDYRSRADETVLAMPMIETPEALENLDEILEVDGIDCVYVGPADLALSLGMPPALEQTDTRMVRVRHDIVSACKRHGVIAGIHCASAGGAREMIAAGYQFITLGSDARFLATKAAAELGEVTDSGDTQLVIPAY